MRVSKAVVVAGRALALLLVLSAAAAPAWAGGPLHSPEIDPASFGSAFTLLAGAVLWLNGRRVDD